VFEADYKLTDLRSVEKYIRQNKHLPEMPSAKEVEEKGISVGDNQALLLKKIEELTLHLININKKQQAMRRTQTLLNRKIALLEERNAARK
jgi:ribosomal protein S15P/S13E